jgi:hypothetical protein
MLAVGGHELGAKSPFGTVWMSTTFANGLPELLVVLPPSAVPSRTLFPKILYMVDRQAEMQTPSPATSWQVILFEASAQEAVARAAMVRLADRWRLSRSSG